MLNFKYHIKSINSKISRALFSLNRVKHLLPQQALKTLYFSLLHCHLLYACEIWSCVPPSLLKDLIIKQKKAVRIISLSKFNSHSEPIFKKLEILPLTLQFSFNKLVFMQSCIYKNSPIAFHNRWIKNRDRRAQAGDFGPDLRDDNDLHVPFSRTDFIARFPLHNLPKLWNDLPHNVDILSNIPEFKLKLKSHFLNNLNDNVQCNRLLCPTCHLGRWALTTTI